MDDLDLEEKINNGFSFNLSQITMESVNDISLIGTYDNEKLKSTNLAEFSINFGFISASLTNKQIFDVNFFLKPGIAEYCKEEKINSYYIKYCKEKVIKEFKSLSFHLPKMYNGESNDIIEFNYQDLFIKCPGYDDTYCFQIVFGSMYSSWILGKPLFRKHNMVFDQEKKIANELEDEFVYELSVKKNNEEDGKNKIFKL